MNDRIRGIDPGSNSRMDANLDPYHFPYGKRNSRMTILLNEQFPVDRQSSHPQARRRTMSRPGPAVRSSSAFSSRIQSDGVSSMPSTGPSSQPFSTSGV